MSINPTNLFAFNRSLPAPFENTSPRQRSVSKYNTGSQATLSPSVMQAVHAYIDCQYGVSLGALGSVENTTVAEYKPDGSDEIYHIAAYDPDAGFITASVYNNATKAGMLYRLAKSAKDGSAIMFALLPTLMKDEEFANTLREYTDVRRDGYTNMDDAVRCASVLCDNAYRRIMDETNPKHVKLNIDNSGNITQIRPAQLAAGTYSPDALLAGEFVVLAKIAGQPKPKPVVSVPHDSFIGKYALSNRVLSVEEQKLLPVLPASHVLDERVVSACRHAQLTTQSDKPMRNFMFRGPSGTGKTEGALAMAAGLGLPHMIFTCSANTEIFDMVGQVFPNVDAATTGDEDLDAQRETLATMGGINAENVMKLMGLPGMDDMEYDPATAYKMLTEDENPAAQPQDCVRISMELVGKKIAALSNLLPAGDKPPYIYTETDFIKAIKNGYLIEIQEPSVITQPGVLVGLNALLEHNGRITLPTGEIVCRHPDTVVVITTNTMYEGCNAMNQAVVDRMDLVMDFEQMTPELMAKRAQQVTGFDDMSLLIEMAKVVDGIAEYMRHNNIFDGTCGMRSLISWVQSTQITGDPYTSALYTVVSKAATDKRDQDSIIEAVLDPSIPRTTAAA